MIDNLIGTDSSRENACFLNQSPHDQPICYLYSQARVFHGLQPCLIFKDIPTIEVFTYISPDIVLQQELATWVLRFELPHVEYKVIKYDELFSPFDPLLELFECNKVVCLGVLGL